MQYQCRVSSAKAKDPNRSLPLQIAVHFSLCRLSKASAMYIRNCIYPRRRFLWRFESDGSPIGDHQHLVHLDLPFHHSDAIRSTRAPWRGSAVIYFRQPDPCVLAPHVCPADPSSLIECWSRVSSRTGFPDVTALVQVTQLTMSRTSQKGNHKIAQRSWWARQVSNLRPIGYEPTALPLSYGPLNQSLNRGQEGVKERGLRRAASPHGPVCCGPRRTCSSAAAHPHRPRGPGGSPCWCRR